MKKVMCVAVAILAVLAVSRTGATNAAPKSIKEIMSAGHKGDPPLCAKANMGKATKEEVAKLLALYEDLPKNKPPLGEEASWQKKTTALIEATKKLAANPEDKDAVAGYKAAVNCAGCHGSHRPKK